MEYRRLEGTGTALITPFLDTSIKKEVNYKGIQELVQHQINEVLRDKMLRSD